MRICLLLVFCISSFVSVAQSESFSAETFWLKKLPEDAEIEEDIESYFPIIQSAKNPGAAAAINMVLQMETFGMTLNEKNKADLLKMYSAGYAFQTGSYNFVLKKITGRLLYVGIGRYRTNNAMNLNGHYEMKHFYFDATTGLRTYRKEWFTKQGLSGVGRLVANDFKGEFISSIAQFRDGFSEKDFPAFNQECECDCMEYINNAFCGTSMMIDYAAGTFTLTIEDCDWMNPRPHFNYVANVSSSEVTPLLSLYGKFLFTDGAPVLTSSAFRLWKGTIGKIPIHFKLDTNDNCLTETMGNGQEIYDKYGVCIQTSWSIEDNGTKIIMEELDKGNPIARISATLQGGKLVGTWTKKDGSKTLPFEAVLATPGPVK